MTDERKDEARTRGASRSCTQHGKWAPNIHFRVLSAIACTLALSLAANALAQTNRLDTLGEEFQDVCGSFDSSVSGTTKNDDVEETAGTSTAVSLPCDNQTTPAIKTTGPGVDKWRQIAGAKFGASEVVGAGSAQSSVTPFDAELYAVGFRNTKFGLIGGSVCSSTPPPRQEDESLDAYLKRVKKCAASEGAEGPRVPIAYLFSDRDKEGPAVIELFRGATRGYVGAAAWIDSNTALLVGGDGVYPHRERGRERNPAGEITESDAAYAERDVQAGAGMARVWLYDDGVVRELKNEPDPPAGFDGSGGDELPDTMRALTAAAFHPGGNLYTPNNSRPEGAVGFVGGFRQLWEWKDGLGFVQGYGDVGKAPTGILDRAESFRFRVRAITFKFQQSFVGSPSVLVSYWVPWAATAGCCAAREVHNFPRLMASRAEATWFMQVADSGDSESGLSKPSTIYGLGTGGTIVTSPDGPPPRETDLDYELRRIEPSSIITREAGVPTSGGSSVHTADPYSDQSGRLAPVRLIGGDDEAPGWPPETKTAAGSSPSFPFGVGSITHGPLRGQGVSQEAYSSSNLSIDSVSVEGAQAGVMRKAYASQKIFALPSYGLNAVDVVGTSGVVWAVGNHGAILRAGENAEFATDEPLPPKLGNRGSSALANRSPYADQAPREAAEDVGRVPSLADVSLERLQEPRFVHASTSDLRVTPHEIVMSRDGSEGWAFASNGDSNHLYRLRGSLWERCDPDGDPKHGVPPDRACEGMTAPIAAATRIPYENDTDPTNDGRFEVVGIEPPLQGGSSVSLWRYSGGRWERDPNPKGDLSGTRGPYSLAFTSPTDGWIVTGYGCYVPLANGCGQARQQPRIYRFVAQSGWVSCKPGSAFPPGTPPDRTPMRQQCADWNDLIPYGDSDSAGADPPIGVMAVGTSVYLYGTRSVASANGDADPLGQRWPLLLYRNSGNACTATDRSGCWQQVLDPGCEGRTPTPPSNSAAPCIASDELDDRGQLQGVSIVERLDGAHEGWLSTSAGGDTQILRIAADGRVAPWREPAGTPLSDYALLPNDNDLVEGMIGYPQSSGGVRYVAQSPGRENARGPLLELGPDEERFSVLPGPWGSAFAPATLLAPDGMGGFWAWATTGSNPGGFYHYTDLTPEPIFSETPHPIREAITDLAGTRDGTLWVSTDRNVLYRYDRLAGWERVQIPGWDPGKLQTSGSPVSTVAVGSDGTGVAVGPGGRIAQITPSEVRLDAAAGTSCASLTTIVPPCGTSRDLVSADVAPDGSALVGGKKKALLFRPAGDQFRAIQTPELSHNATFSSISYPRADRAYLVTDLGQIYVGDRVSNSFSWRLENLDEGGQLITRLAERNVAALIEISVDDDGHGYAITSTGELFERIGEGRSTQAWRATSAPFSVDAVAKAEGVGDSVLLGGPRAEIATGEAGQFALARTADPLDPLSGDSTSLLASARSTTRVVGLALLPGGEAGEVDAWAAINRPGSSFALLRHTSDRSDPLLNPELRASPLPDSPLPRVREVSFAAFGKSDCPRRSVGYPACPEFLGGATRNEMIAQRIVEEVSARSEHPGGPMLSLFTGDVSDGAGTGGGFFSTPNVPIDRSVNQHRWRELIAEGLMRRGIPLFGAIGGQDLNTTERCGLLPRPDTCQGTRTYEVGPNIAWREAMAPMPSPWGEGEEAETGSLRFEPVEDSIIAEMQKDVKSQDLGGDELEEDRDNVFDTPASSIPEKEPTGGIFAPQQDRYSVARTFSVSAGDTADRSVPRLGGALSTAGGGARTHYAFDLVETESDERLARVVVIDTSLRSLAASDAQQNPAEPQAAWLESVLCVSEEAIDTGDCTREPRQPAIVLSNTPTYSYGPGYAQSDPVKVWTNLFAGALDGADTQADAATMEAILMKNNASVVVSGRIGWNAFYWATAPGIHEPCPGGEYPNPYDPPERGTRICGQGSTSLPDPSNPGTYASETADLFRDRGIPIPRESIEDNGTQLPGALPFVISSSAGGKFAAQGDASNGFWSGYAIVRVSSGGHPADTIVEQRPVFDWLSLNAHEHTLLPGQRTRLIGIGREVAGLDDPAVPQPLRYDEISTPAITHRYELLAADPDEPWLPKLDPGVERESLTTAQTRYSEDPCGPYVCLDPMVGTVQDQTGVVKAGNGKYPDTFAIALLSVGDHVASWPLVFKRSPSFAVDAAAGQAQIPSAPASAGSAPQPPAPPTPSQPGMPQTSAPNIPAPPPLAPLSAAQPPEPQPPAPPAPPPPSEQPSALSLTLAPPSIALATPTAVIQPPTPPVNPAPPSGARREARQRQAATQKSGADGAQEQGEGLSDTAQGPPSASGSQSMTRLDASRAERRRPEPSFTPLARAEQPSAWGQGALYAGGLTLIAFALAAGWSRGRPTPKSRPPEVPAPATARVRSRF